AALVENRRCVMPRGDRTGPEGGGPRTGRAAGFCAGFDSPGYINQAETLRGGAGFGGRMGMGNRRGMGAYGGPGFRGAGFQGGGRGSGMRLRGRYYDGGGSAPNQASELDILRGDADRLEIELAAVKDRMKKLESE
ncbi:MAG: DUF5320 domain-containing protein, partial [Bacteroidales bacterium]|nr:DUF5320 domain-containing protein [Candidatus Latescibacterota bacterium]